MITQNYNNTLFTSKPGINTLRQFKSTQSSNFKNSSSFIANNLLTYYKKLYTLVICKINEILLVFQTSEINEIISLYNQNSFINLITKVSQIKNQVLLQFSNYSPLPTSVLFFLNNYISHTFTILHSLQYMISYISQYDDKSKCCKILENLESIQKYIDQRFSKDNSTLTTSTVSTIPIRLKEPYNTYLIKHGPPGHTGFDPELLGEISAELNLSF